MKTISFVILICWNMYKDFCHLSDFANNLCASLNINYSCTKITDVYMYVHTSLKCVCVYVSMGIFKYVCMYVLVTNNFTVYPSQIYRLNMVLQVQFPEGCTLISFPQCPDQVCGLFIYVSNVYCNREVNWLIASTYC